MRLVSYPLASVVTIMVSAIALSLRSSAYVLLKKYSVCYGQVRATRSLSCIYSLKWMTRKPWLCPIRFVLARI